MNRNSQHPPLSTLPLAGRVAKLEAKPRSEAGEGGAKPANLAKKLRAQPSPIEVRLWRMIYGLRVGGYHFRKQVRIGSYIVDFACLHAGLVIEVDGRTHEGDLAQSNDAVRDDYLRGRGFTVLRFSNHDVMHEAEGVYATIEAALRGRPPRHRGSAPPLPSSPARGEVPLRSGGTIEPILASSSSPSPASLGPDGPSSATLPARGRVTVRGVGKDETQ